MQQWLYNHTEIIADNLEKTLTLSGKATLGKNLFPSLHKEMIITIEGYLVLRVYLYYGKYL